MPGQAVAGHYRPRSGRDERAHHVDDIRHRPALDALNRIGAEISVLRLYDRYWRVVRHERSRRKADDGAYETVLARKFLEERQQLRRVARIAKHREGLEHLSAQPVVLRSARERDETRQYGALATIAKHVHGELRLLPVWPVGKREQQLHDAVVREPYKLATSQHRLRSRPYGSLH